jgi:hypothetical protein
MSLNMLRKQVKFCLIDGLAQKEKPSKKKLRNLNKKELDDEIRLENNLKYFDLQKKHKNISKNVMKFIKLAD